ncbi:response regulator [Oleiharenicola lentus]|uniref:response regulator n=1 Tax=Oleiharenicola lentus TaxID=2508720 RepID=UPI003F6677E8
MSTPARRILVIDDRPDNVALLFDFLRDQNYKVLVSESGEHALAELPHIAPDLILLDVMMPGIDGFETCRRLKADPLWKDVPVFFMTALGDPVDKVRGLELGAVDYITKPISPAEVLARISVHLELRATQRTLAERNAALEEQNERLDQAIQQRIAAERTLEQSLDRAVIVASVFGAILFCSGSAARLLDRHQLKTPDGKLPEDVQVWLATGGDDTFVLAEGAALLTFTRVAPGKQPQNQQLVYLSEKSPPPSPEMLHPLGLTPRENEILFWIAQGKTSPEIGIILGSAPSTVKKHVENITAKLGVETRLAAAIKAMEVLGLPG